MSSKKTKRGSGSRNGSRSSSAKSRGKSTDKSKSKSTAKSGSRNGLRTAPGRNSRNVERDPIIDERAASDIWGIVLLALGVALGLAVVLTQTGVVAEFIAMGLGLIVGIGRFFLPFALIIMGLTFFIPALRFTEARFAIGLSCLMVAIVGIVGLSAVGVPSATPFEATTLQAHGGYLGNALAWSLYTLLGAAISYVILIALAVIGLVITGISLSGIFEWLSEFQADRAEERAHREAEKAALTPRTEKIAKVASGNISAARGGKRKNPAPNTLDEQPTEVLSQSNFDDELTQVIEDKKAARLAAAAEKARATKGKAVDDSGDTQVIDTDTSQLNQNTTAPRALDGFVLPSIDLLSKSSPDNSADSPEAEAMQQKTADALVDTLRVFDVDSRVVDWIVGPTVTLYKVEIAKGIRLNKVTALANDLSLALAAPTLRILAPIPGESLVGVEVPNLDRSSVTLGDIITPADSADGPLTLFMGRDITGASIARNLAGMPHLLIGGSTGSGKSVAINTMIMSILMRATPAEVRMVLIDPKRVELSMFNGLPHLYVPVVTTPKEAASALAWAVNEMDRRLKVLEKARVRNIGEYNQSLQDGKLDEGVEEMPYLVIVIDELADLMMVSAKEVESSIVRIAQLARAAGIHLIVATQRPDANVVTPLIKANITNRVAFRTATAIDSRVVLDQSGAEQLTGLGDMLFSIPAWPHPKRVQGCYVSEQEIEAVVESIKEQSGEVEYQEDILATLNPSATGGSDSAVEDDPLLWEAAEMVVAAGFGSTSGIQRRFKVGYSRAGRIMDMLQSRGVVGPPDGSKPREVLIDVEALAQMMAPDGEEDT
ncbi:MAG: DNA translocase FtsK [Coriobacteriia bacterium]|nr:DNA translocase FtsK [Coriobacteriia bacterium]MCL2745964.1 DNA translocase FtsK [Coriobacteriia bacterium]MCL2870063.1 DNA translocase FtsK [Coriobacteriia bacterium]